MTKSTREVLQDHKGIVEALGVTVIIMTLIIAIGGVVANFALLSHQASTLTTLSNEITNRAEAYAGALNADLTAVQTPSTARECSTVTQVCTQLLAVTTSADGKRITLRIQADAVTTISETRTQDVDLFASEVTHVTAIDEDNTNVWALTDEGLRFRIWSLAVTAPSDVSDGDVPNPEAGLSWAAVDDRAGIDSTGALWVWGKNTIGQAGIGTTGTTMVLPTRVGGSEKFRSVVTEDDRAYAIDMKGQLWAWGKNTAGQLGLGHKSNVIVPTMVPAVPGVRYMSVAVGKDNALALTSAGDVRVAGAAQAGFGDVTGSSWRALTTGTRYTSLATSSIDAKVALLTDAGTVRVNGTTLPAPTGVTFTSVTRGATAGYAISTTGDLYAFGQGSNGELGLGATTSVSAATKVTGAPKVISVAGSRSGALAVTATGELYFAGKVHRPYEGAGPAATSTTFMRLTTGKSFRQVAGNPTDETFAIKDKDGNLLSAGGKSPGLWPMNWLGGADQIVRMPTPEGFASYTWK